MKKLLLIAAAILAPVLASAQIIISGQITDKNSALPLAGAGIKVENTQINSRSNAQGRYSLRLSRPGNYRISVSYLGYKTRITTIDISNSRQLDIELLPDNMLADEVIVRSTRASANSATTYQNLSKDDIQKNNLGQDLPFLLNTTPSVVVSSDAGNGIGYTGIRIRGSDPTRTNVTINGIPYNDPESQGTFWVNLPDFASSVDNIQIQRGVGTSTNGAGAFGGSLNIQTATRRDSAYAEINNTAGSFNTFKNTVSLGTGLLGKFTVDGRLSRISSDGYIDRGSSDLKSYFLGAAWYGKNTLLRANVFSGTEKTYQSWNGVPEHLLDSDRTYNGFEYHDQTDNYTQNHYQLLLSQVISDKFSVNTALHYTRGEGYYEEFKEGQTLSNYGLPSYTNGSVVIDESDLVRRRWLANDFYGFTYSLNYLPSKLLGLTLGGAYNEYDGDHFGEVIRGQFIPVDLAKQRYYNGTGFKRDFNSYLKADLNLGDLSIFADLQFRRVNYLIYGTDKNRMNLDQNDQLNFFNPKAGLTYQLDPLSNIYASVAIANKEPNRDDYINSTPANRPRSENLTNIEAGYRYAGSGISGAVNGYLMDYRDQLVLTGKVNDVGEYIRQNVPDSYRYGLEAEAKLQLNPVTTWGLNASLSRNKIRNFTEFIDDYDNGGQIVNQYKNTNLAFSPDLVASSEISIRPFPKTEMALISKYVGSQYLDNTSNNSRMLDAFFVNDIRLGYNTSFRNVKNIGLTLLVNNVFSEKYEANGYSFSYLYGGEMTTENWYFPQAPANFLLQLSLKF